MRVKIYKSRRNCMPIGVDFSGTTFLDLANRNDGVIVDGNITHVGFRTGTVDDQAASNNEIMGHGIAPICR